MEPEIEPITSKFRFSELQSLLVIVTMAVGGIAWGMKLDMRTYENRMALEEIRNDLKPGMLPITKERLNNLERRIEALEDAYRSILGHVHPEVTKNREASKTEM